MLSCWCLIDRQSGVLRKVRLFQRTGVSDDCTTMSLYFISLSNYTLKFFNKYIPKTLSNETKIK